MKVPVILLVLGPLFAMSRTCVVAEIIPSPTHAQTFAYGSERHQEWTTRGPDRHLALRAEFTNDPYVDQVNIRYYDDFLFDFPNVRLAGDGRTFLYRAPGGHTIPVAVRSTGFLGLNVVRLLDTSHLIINKRHGYLTLEIVVD